VGSTPKDAEGLAQPGDAHLPEVSDGVGQRPLRGDVRWHPRVVLDLEKERGCQTARQGYWQEQGTLQG